MWSALAIVAALAAFVLGVAVASRTDWGQERARLFLISQAGRALEGRGRLTIGRFRGGLGGQFVLDSVTLGEASGSTVFRVSHLELHLDLAPLMRGRVRVHRLLLVRPFALLEQGRDSVWNVSRLFTSATPKSSARSALDFSLDSAEVRDGLIRLVMPDTLRRLPLVRRDFSALQLLLGPTRVAHRDTAGGLAPVRRLSMQSSKPPLALRDAAGVVRWWADSLRLDFPSLHLPASSGSLRGTIAWAQRGPARLSLALRADTVAFPDIAWITTLVPKHGGGSADVLITNGTNPADIEYRLSNVDVGATRSRITGAFTAVTGRRTSIVNLALEAHPLDLDLVRELFGDSVPKKVWQGSLTGSVRGRGGPLDSLRLDDVRLTFADRRVKGGATSHFALSGEVNTLALPSELRALTVQIEDLDVRTTGAVVQLADSLHGVLTGRVVLDGPTSDLRFHDLALRHVDGDRAASVVSGEGRIATDIRSHWFDATLVLDTVAVATLARDRTAAPLRGFARGTLELHATADTMTVDALMRSGDGTLRFAGTTLLDTVRSRIRGRATLTAFDPRAFVSRNDIPVMRLGGVADVSIDGNRAETDGHVAFDLDTTTVIGDSRVTLAQMRVGFDSSGLHVDTAEIQATEWRVSAAGRLARRGATHDTLRFAVKFNSLAPLGALLLDAKGRSLADSLSGSAGATGVLVGSLDTLTLTTRFDGLQLRSSEFSMWAMRGEADLTGLPSAATGTVSFSADTLTAGPLKADRVDVRADAKDGKAARVVASLRGGDTLHAATLADVRVSGDTTRVVLDSLTFALGTSSWHLATGGRATIVPGGVTLDSTTLVSAQGATLTARASIADAGPVTARLALDKLSVAELVVTGYIDPDVSGRVGARIDLTGTRDAPHISATASLDSMVVGDRDAPSLVATAVYDSHRASVGMRGAFRGREVLSVSGTVPVDLSLRAVPKRLLDDSLRLRIHADSASLAGLESVTQEVHGLAGTLDADVDVGGTWKRFTGIGSVTVRGGAFDVPKYGVTARALTLDVALAPDSVALRRLVLGDGDSGADTLSATGTLVRKDGVWQVDIASQATNFSIIDDPRFAQIEASWRLQLRGPLSQPFVGGEMTLPRATLVIDPSRRVRPLVDEAGMSEDEFATHMPLISALRVTLGNDVRLKSRDANVQLAGELEVGGAIVNPFISGEILANRGTYRVDLGLLKRTFRVDSGLVRVAGTRETPVALDIWTSYLVRSQDRDDVKIVAHVTGTTQGANLELSSADLGVGSSQSEIISYLVFGSPTFGLDGQGTSAMKTATAALVPSLGGLLEGTLGTLLPFLSSLQVTTVAGSGPQNLAVNPLDGLLNSFALTAGRQLGSDTFLSLSAGMCRSSRLSSASSVAGWFGLGAEYRPRNRAGVSVSMDPGSSPCNRVGRFLDVYQFGADVFREWRLR